MLPWAAQPAAAALPAAAERRSAALAASGSAARRARGLEHRRLGRSRGVAVAAARGDCPSSRRAAHLLPRPRAVVGRDREVAEAHELDAEHRTGGRVVRDQLLDDVRRACCGSVTACGVPAITTRRVSRRASMRSMLRDTLRSTPSLTASNGRPTNCAIEQRRIDAADLQRAGRAQAHRLTGRRDHELRRACRTRPRPARSARSTRATGRDRIRRAPAMASRAEPIADHPRRAHHDELVVRARHLVSSGPIGNGQAYTRWSDATASRAMTGINAIVQDLDGEGDWPRPP